MRLLTALIVLSLLLPHFAIVTRDTIVFDGYGFTLYAGTVVMVIDREPIYCNVAWEDHNAVIPCENLARIK